MQKFTIFTIIFSVLVITVTSELVVQDYLQKLYPNSDDLQANSLSTDDFNDYTKPTTKVTSKIEELLKETKKEDLKPAPDDETETAPSPEPETPTENLSRVETILVALDIENVRYEESQYLGKLFQLIDTSSAPIARSNYALFQVNDDTVGSVYQFQGKSEIDAEKIYEHIKQKALNYPEITVNDTNQFGDESFYINHIVKVGEVFVVFRQDNTVYAFAYKKELHEKFKEFFDILV